MILFDYTKPKMIVADKGKKIKAKNDNYKKEYIDEESNVIPEHIPYYSTTIFVPDNFTEEMMKELYEEVENEQKDQSNSSPLFYAKTAEIKSYKQFNKKIKSF